MAFCLGIWKCICPLFDKATQHSRIYWLPHPYGVVLLCQCLEMWHCTSFMLCLSLSGCSLSRICRNCVLCASSCPHLSLKCLVCEQRWLAGQQLWQKRCVAEAGRGMGFWSPSPMQGPRQFTEGFIDVVQYLFSLVPFLAQKFPLLQRKKYTFLLSLFTMLTACLRYKKRDVRFDVHDSNAYFHFCMISLFSSGDHVFNMLMMKLISSSVGN